MIVLSHRGYWKLPSEKNTKLAFERSFSMGFGTETDIRDRHSKLVISHDMADDKAIALEDFFAIYRQYPSNLPLALNIKADGLGSMPFSVELDLTGTDALAGRPAAWPAAWGLKASA